MNLGMLKLFSLFILLNTLLFANNKSIDFDFIKKGIDDNNTLLIVGGIQGDEPGAFMAASIISTNYKITKGSVWVVPNLNFYSIIKKSRGPYGDMNRKFASISKNDPDFESIQRIKSYIKAPNVKIVLNLHDGSGFYRKEHTNWTFSPNRWGQSVIIDQDKVNVDKYGNLLEISTKVCAHVNNFALRQRDEYRVKNTKTKEGDKEMEKTLTYFAINNGKAAFGNEASKSLSLKERTYYHLLAIEKYMNIMGIEFERNFELNTLAINNIINDDIYMSFYDDKIQLPLSKIRTMLKYFPVDKNGVLEFTPSNPLMTIIKNDENYTIHYGNRKLVNLKPDYLDIDENDKEVKMLIDGKLKKEKIGSIVDVNSSFKILSLDGYRVNIIGFVQKNLKNEVDVLVEKEMILKKFSVDKKGTLFRVEFYKDDKFAGMILMNFDKEKQFNKEKSSLVISKKKITKLSQL